MSRRLASACSATSANGRPWPDSASRAPSTSVASSEVQELAHRVRRVAVVEVERDAARAGGRPRSAAAARTGTARRATARGPASRAPTRCRGRSRRRGPGAGRGRAAAARRPASAPSAAGRAGRRSGARSRRGGRARHRGRRRRRRSAGGLGAPTPPARPVGDRVRLPAVVGVGVRDDEKPHVLDLKPDLVERALEVGSSSPPRRCRCRRARCRRRPRSPTRCSAGRPARATAGAAARGRGAHARRGPPPAVRSACAWDGTVLSGHGHERAGPRPPRP